MREVTAARRGAVLGHPIGHSKSPQLHAAGYAVLGLDYAYTAQDLQVPEFPAFLEQVRADGGWYGLSVTMPLKQAAATLVDICTPVARALGAVNTIVITQRDGVAHLVGDNTDVAGIVGALRHAGVTGTPRCAILGAGGTAVSALAALAALGVTGADVFVRTPARAADTVRVAATLGVTATVRAFSEAAAALGGFDVVISTLPPHGADAVAATLQAPAGTLAGACLLDVAYDPWPSAVASAWAAAGGTVVPGIEMLLYQGVEQVKLFAAAGGHTDALQGREAALLDVMCDALGLERRPPNNLHE